MRNPTSTILVVEDIKTDQILITRALQSCRPQKVIQVVESGVEALAYLQGQGKYADRTKYAFPCMVTTDLKMPKVGGFDVLSFFQSHRALAFVPVIVLTGSQDADDIKQSYKLGAGAYLVKPNSLAELRQLMEMVCTYWTTCELPAMDPFGCELPTASAGKLGEKFSGVLEK